MSEKDWSDFENAVTNIIQLPGTWMEKRAILDSCVKVLGIQGSWHEIINWYGGDTEE